MTSTELDIDNPLFNLIEGFVVELRHAGLPVSLSENIDAAEAVQHIPIEDRTAFKYALAATLVKNDAHWKTFETLFEVYFSLRGSEYALDPDADDPFGELDLDDDEMAEQASGDAGQGQGGGDGLSPEELAELLYQALLRGDDTLLRAIARQAVKRFAGMEPGRPVGGTYYLYRTLRQLDADALFDRLLNEALEAAGDDITELDRRLIREDVQARFDEFRSELEAEIRRRLVADRGSEAVARTLRRPLVEDTELMHATRTELKHIEDVIQPLTRKLAARLARQRKLKRTGRLDFRKTVRHSLSTGGVPVEPYFRAPKPHKPEILLLCDISGSMATFARFTLQFVYAMGTQFSKVRSFAFIDALDEVTDFFAPGVDFADALQRISSDAEVVWLDGHSDYGRSLEMFTDRYASAVTPRSTVIITGDARNNYRPANADLLGNIAHTARSVYWLNPEPRAYWNTGDSVMDRYGVHCTAVHEVRNLRQLEEFVDALSQDSLTPKVRSGARR